MQREEWVRIDDKYIQYCTYKVSCYVLTILENKLWTRTIEMSFTCVVASVHISMVVAHSIQVIQIVIRVSSQAIWPSPRRPMGRQTPAALASLNNMRCHVHTHQWKPHHVLHLHPPIPLLKQVSIWGTSPIYNLHPLHAFTSLENNSDSDRKITQTRITARVQKEICTMDWIQCAVKLKLPYTKKSNLVLEMFKTCSTEDLYSNHSFKVDTRD